MSSLITEKIDAAMALLVEARALANPPDAPYAARTDRTPEPKPTLPTLGPAGFSFEDPTFGRRILRVTDGTVGLTWRVPSNAHITAWNADSTKFEVINGGGGVQLFAFDAATFTARPTWMPYSQAEPEFSRIDPDAIYTVAGANTRTIRQRSIAHRDTWTDVIDLDTLGLPGLADPRTYVGSIQCGGSPEALAVLFGGESQDRHHYVLWQPLAGPPKLLNSLRPSLGFYLHAISMDLSARYVLLYPVNAQPYQVVVWDTVTDTCTSVTKSPGGHDALGYGIWVNQDQGALPYDACQWQLRELSRLDVTRDLIEPVQTPKEVYLADHTSWNHAKPDVRVPVISATYRYGANDTPWRAWDDEILGIATQGPSTVWRFAHHRSDVSVGFSGQPMINVAPNGKYCLFQSNWEQTLGPGRTDVFLLELT